MNIKHRKVECACVETLSSQQIQHFVWTRACKYIQHGKLWCDIWSDMNYYMKHMIFPKAGNIHCSIVKNSLCRSSCLYMQLVTHMFVYWRRRMVTQSQCVQDVMCTLFACLAHSQFSISPREQKNDTQQDKFRISLPIFFFQPVSPHWFHQSIRWVITVTVAWTILY